MFSNFQLRKFLLFTENSDLYGIVPFWRSSFMQLLRKRSSISSITRYGQNWRTESLDKRLVHTKWSYLKLGWGLTEGTCPSMTPLSFILNTPSGSSNAFNLSSTDGLKQKSTFCRHILHTYLMWTTVNKLYQMNYFTFSFSKIIVTFSNKYS